MTEISEDPLEYSTDYDVFFIEYKIFLTILDLFARYLQSYELSENNWIIVLNKLRH